MTSPERFRRYLAGEPTDRAPALEWAPWWNLTIDRWRKEGLPEHIKSTEDIQGFFGLDKCLQTYGHWSTHETPRAASHGAGIMQNEADWKCIRKTMFPPVETVISKAHFEALQKKQDRGDTLNFFTVDGFFWYPRALFGIENHFYSFYDYPQLYKEICTVYSDWMTELFHYVFSKFKFDFMTFAEDMSYNGGPMISEQLFDKFLAPFYKKVIPVIHSYSIPVFIDSDGDITKAVDWYAKTGVDGMLPLERKAGVDVSVYIKKQPQMAFLGHFDKMCMKHGKDAMRAEFERILPSMENGKVIVSVDHQTPPDVPIDYYRDYVDLLFEYCGKITHKNAEIEPCPVYKSDT